MDLPWDSESIGMAKGCGQKRRFEIGATGYVNLITYAPN